MKKIFCLAFAFAALTSIEFCNGGSKYDAQNLTYEGNFSTTLSNQSEMF